LINPDLDPEALSLTYRDAEPFPHIVIDDFLVPELAEEIADELDSCDMGDWFRDDHTDQVLKRSMPDT
jgi:hypothetical protein